MPRTAPKRPTVSQLARQALAALPANIDRVPTERLKFLVGVADQIESTYPVTDPETKLLCMMLRAELTLRGGC